MKKKLQAFYLKSFFGLTILFFICAFSTMAQVHIAGGGNYATIQAAVDASAPGSVINVDAGTYNENVIVPRSLTIQGPNAAISPNSGSRVTEAIIDAGGGRAFSTNTANSQVTIKGFYIKNGSPLHDNDLSRDPLNPASGNISVTFQNNIVSHGYNLFCGTLTMWQSVTITNNLFQNIDNTTLNSSPSAIQLNDAVTVLKGAHAPVINAVITDNVIDHANFAGILLDNIASASVMRNKISFVSDAAIHIASANPNLVIQNNVIDNANTANNADDGAIRLFAYAGLPSENFSGKADIQYNLVTNTLNGFAAMAGANLSSVNVNNNSFILTKAIYNGTTTPLNATCNWYGTACKTDITSKISGPVTYIPYLNNGTDNDPAATGFQPVPNSCVTPAATIVITQSSITDASCGNNNGAIAITVSGGSSPYSFSWTKDGGTTVYSTQQNISNLAPGNYTVTVTDSYCNSQTKTFIVGTSSGTTLTNVTISTSSADDFCYGITLTANPTPASGTYTYLWSNGATTKSIHLDNSNPDGNYSVTVTGCGSKSATYNYQKQNVAGNYTILALSAVDFEQTNNVQRGSIGAQNCYGWIYADHNSSIASPGSFAKASYIFVSSTSNVPTRIYSAAAATLPTFQYNTSSCTGLSNFTVADNATVTLAGNYKNLTIGKNATVTLKGNVFYDVDIKSGAYVTFISTVVNVHSLNVEAGTATRYTTLHFSSNCNVKSSEDINVCSKVRINPENMNVTIYVGDKDNENDNVVVDGTDTKIYSNIYLANGCLTINGCNTTATTCYMMGMFIANKVISKCNYVVWNPHDCLNPNPPIVSGRTSIGEAVAIKIQEAKGVTKDLVADVLTTRVLPNPTKDHFVLLLKSPSSVKVKINVYDANGKRVEQFQGSPDLKFQFGDNYKPGLYLVDIWQAADHVTTKVIKQ